ncbi:MAG: DUF814 domain-containing protein [Nitrosopumilaceae archaeon]|nr:fibronectin-binding domain-containing protein [Nitrosopumilaceae archaeon]NIU01913.1 fibronectin-binding domain-containing protein [Nitrosopumilaceae archaeon]NIU88317.1 DUF814 domain-containing protein [Nitrosopumilaceae archaeon]NIV66609.1 DUF814 domain-containing protein [Nitrosopumilaceae archaeon]NIX62514.1 DUF814 domain-containing protein [Nitrosopumilaceae archaeon]
MALSGLEIRYLVNSISEKTQGYYVSNIYSVTRNSILIKLHHPENPDIFLMLSTFGMWTTSTKVEEIEKNNLVTRLRRDLVRLKLTNFEQPNAERIVYLTFSGFDKEFVLVAELFGDGNIILCNKEMKILALLHSIDVRHRRLAVGLQYVLPPQSGLDVFEIAEDEFKGIKDSDIQAAKWIGRNLGLPKRYTEEIFARSKIDSKIPGNKLTDEQVQSLFYKIKELVSEITTGNHQPIIVETDKDIDVIPIKLSSLDGSFTSVKTFEDGLDQIFTKKILQKGYSVQSDDTSKKIIELNNQIEEQRKAISTVQEKSQAISRVAKSLFELSAKGVSSLEDSKAKEFLEELDTKITTEKGSPILVIHEQKIPVDLKSSIPTVASLLFDEAKRQKAATTSIESHMEKTQKNIEKLQEKSKKQKDTVTVTEIRKKKWFERYRWFFTSDGLLAIGGRDTSSNSAIIRKHLEKNDLVFHAEVFGSPFFIIKDGKDCPHSTLDEVAHSTVCFSRAWREGLYGVNSYWINPDQVKKGAPSGQFLPKGSFIIEGTRNYMKVSTLKLGIGLTEYEGDYLIECGSPQPIIKNCFCYAIIEPSGSEMPDLAKKIRGEFGQRYEGIVKSISIDDFVRALPAGKAHLSEINVENNARD